MMRIASIFVGGQFLPKRTQKSLGILYENSGYHYPQYYFWLDLLLY